MKAIERLLKVATAAWCIGYFFLPTRVSFLTGFGLFFFAGVWCVAYPPGMLGLAKGIDPDDKRLWWVTRVIGIGFIAMAVYSIATTW